MTGPALTVAIPTYNRAGYLAQNLAQLRRELVGIAPGTVEVLVSDNCSPDDTPAVVEAAVRDGMPIRYVRNAENIGWGRNFAQCFHLASGMYTLLLGDDDLLVDGTLALLLDRLAGHEYGVVLLRAYGFDGDFKREYPGGGGRERRFEDANEFLVAVGPQLTLISSCVFNKRLIADVDTSQFAAGDLGALPLALRAALAAPENLYLDRYLIAGKRQNSFSYDYATVFVDELWRIIDEHRPLGLSEDAVRRIERNMLLSYYPFYLLDLLLARRSDRTATLERFARRFGGRWMFELWLAPTLRLPRPLGIVWGAATTLVGRVAGGELRRGLRFAVHRVRQRLQGERQATGV